MAALLGIAGQGRFPTVVWTTGSITSIYRPFNVSEGQEGYPVLKKTGEYFKCTRRLQMWNHLCCGHMRSLVDTLDGLRDLQYNSQKKGKCTDYVFGPETLVLQKQHGLIKLYLFALSLQELRRKCYKYGHGASSARRGRGRGAQAVTHSQAASGHRMAGKKAPPGKGKLGSSLESIRGKSAIDLGRNIGSS